MGFELQKQGLDGLRVALGVVEDSSQNDVAIELKKLLAKFESDLRQGFFVWVTENDLGNCATYNKLGNVRFVLTKTLIDGVPRRIKITGVYKVSNHEIVIDVQQNVGDSIISSNLFLDESLIAGRTSPFDSAGQQAAAFLRQLIIGKGDDPSRLDLTIGDDRSPYPFALKMLRDFSGSTNDQEYTEHMMKKMKDGSNIIQKVSEYRVK